MRKRNQLRFMFLLLIAALLIQTGCSESKPDLEIMLAPQHALSSEQLAAFQSFAEEQITDINGDGKVKVLLYHWPVDIPEEGIRGDIQTLNAIDLKLVAAPEIVLYLMDANVARRYQADWFLNPADLGFDWATKDGVWILTEESVTLNAWITQTRPYYLALRGATAAEAGRFMEQYAAAELLVQALLER